MLYIERGCPGSSGAEDIVHFPVAEFSTGWHKLHEKRVWKGTKMLFIEDFPDR